MRDSEDHATLELPGLMPAAPVVAHPKRTAANRPRKMALQQVQLELLDPVAPPGLPASQLQQHTAATRQSM
jgi:hypothetical protein